MSDFVKPTSSLAMQPVAEKAILPIGVELDTEEGDEFHQDAEEVFALQFTTRHCPACNYEPSAADIFCLSCGEFLEAEEKPQLHPLYCCECGATIASDDIFCLSCGAVLD